MKKLDKKIIIKFSIGIFALLLLVVGATYAYFALNANIEKSTTNISTELDDIGSVALVTGDNLLMDITFTDMKKYSNSDINYYASSNGTTLVETDEVIAYTQVVGENNYSCTYTLVVSDESENSIYTAFQNMDNKSEGQIVLTVDGKDYDFNTTSLFPLTINGNLENVSNLNPGKIKAKLKLVNSPSIDQTGFAGTNIDLAFNVTDFKCEVNNKIYLANEVNKNTTTFSSENLVVFEEKDYSGLNSITYDIAGTMKNTETNETITISDTATSEFVYEDNLWNLSVSAGSYQDASTLNIPSLSYTFDINTDGINNYMVCYDRVKFSNSGLYINVDSLYSDDNGTDEKSTFTYNSLTCSELGVLSNGNHTIEFYFNKVNLKYATLFKFNVQNTVPGDFTGHRYTGKSPNNYVEFNGDTWRIIGSVPTCTSSECATSENLIKIIKDESIGKIAYDANCGYCSGSSCSFPNCNGSWGNNTLYRLLNNYYYGAQNGNGTEGCYSSQRSEAGFCDYTYNGIKSDNLYGQMVENVYWNTGASNPTILGQLVYSNEIQNQTVSGNVGLVAISDYIYSAPSEYQQGKINTEAFHKALKENSWLYGKEEWTGISYSKTLALKGDGAYGYVDDGYPFYGYDVRPVVYLDKDVYILEGDGSKANPYQIAL